MAKRVKKDSAVTDAEQKISADRPVSRNVRADDSRVRMRAYELYLERRNGPGDDLDDWLRAEREVQEDTEAP